MNNPPSGQVPQLWCPSYSKKDGNQLENVSANLPTKISSRVMVSPTRIVWYLARSHNIKISDASVCRILKSNGLNRLLRGTWLRKVHPIRDQKQVPGHEIQVDVKFLTFKDKDDKPINRYQYTAIVDGTRVRALKIFERRNQANAIAFIDYVIGKFPFRIKEVRTDNEHEFQAKFHAY